MIAETPSDVCCCGHQSRMHNYGTGMCMICRRACEKFHAPGEGHHPAPFVIICLVILVIATAAAFGLWSLGAAVVAAIIIKS